MERTSAVLLASLAFVAASLAFANASAVADDVLARPLAAFGGASVIDGVNTLVIEAENVRHGPAGAATVRTTTYFEFPLNVRHEIELEGRRVAMVSTIDGAVLVTPEGNTDLPPRARAAIEAPAMRNPIALLKARHARQVAYHPRGRAEIAAQAVDRIEMQVGTHRTMLAFDAASGRLVRQSYTAPPGDDVQGEIVVTYSDYRTTAGKLVYPFASRAEVNGKLMSQTRVLAIRVNERLDPGLFPSPENRHDEGPSPRVLR